MVNYDRCAGCGFCLTVSTCHSPGRCVGCLSCYWACPYEARELIESPLDGENSVTVYVDGRPFKVPGNVTVAKALEYLGFRFDPPGSRGLSLACRTSGCWACALVIDGGLERTCVTPVRDGMRVELDASRYRPLRIVHGPEPHVVGGKGTPWWEVDYVNYVEAAIWVAGCNLRCRLSLDAHSH